MTDATPAAVLIVGAMIVGFLFYMNYTITSHETEFFTKCAEAYDAPRDQEACVTMKMRQAGLVSPGR